MSQIESASVQYNDMKGSIAIDFHGGGDGNLWDYARDLGIDTDKYHPIGLSVYIGEHNNVYLTFICVDNASRDSFQEQNNGKIPLITFDRRDELSSFFQRLKRFHAVMGFKRDEFEPHEIVTKFDQDDNPY